MPYALTRREYSWCDGSKIQPWVGIVSTWVYWKEFMDLLETKWAKQQFEGRTEQTQTLIPKQSTTTQLKVVKSIYHRQRLNKHVSSSEAHENDKNWKFVSLPVWAHLSDTFTKIYYENHFSTQPSISLLRHFVQTSKLVWEVQSCLVFPKFLLFVESEPSASQCMEDSGT